MEQTETDAHYMKRAIELAYRGYGTTSPNPPVGAVLVRNGVIIGEGYHRKAGEWHAERNAIADALAKGNAELLSGATLYVTLEPCSTVGRTPACTDAILERGIARVVYGAVDPDERHRGRADAVLRAGGVEVQAGVEKAACELLLRSWAFAVTHRRPWVTAKMATTLDGRLSRGPERAISTPESLRYAHELRLRSDAILIGGETARRDNPSLTIRCPLSVVPDIKEQPWRIVLTNKGIPGELKLLTDDRKDRTLVYRHVDDFAGLLHELYERYGIVNLMTECGGRLLRRLLEQGLVNEWQQEIAPVLCGGSEEVLPGDYLGRDIRLIPEKRVEIGSHWLVRGILA